MRVARRWPVASARDPRTPACGEGLVFSRQSFLQDLLVQRQLRDRLLQTLVLALELFQALGLINLQASVLAPPFVVGLLRDPCATADLARSLPLREPHFGFTQEADDLLRRLPLPCHVQISC